MYCICHLANLKLSSSAFKALQKIEGKNFVPGLFLKNGDQLSKNLSHSGRSRVSALAPWLTLFYGWIAKQNKTALHPSSRSSSTTELGDYFPNPDIVTWMNLDTVNTQP